MTNSNIQNAKAENYINNILDQMSALQAVQAAIVWTEDRLKQLKQIDTELDYLLDEIEDTELD